VNSVRVTAAGVAAFVCLALASVAGTNGRDEWAALHRPLHLPKLAAGTRCPVSTVDRGVAWSRIDIFGGSGVGVGPVYPGLGASKGLVKMSRDEQYGGPWSGVKVFWYVTPDYRGPVLIRGRRLDGTAKLGFNGAKSAASELRISPGETVAWQGRPSEGRGVPSAVRALSAGCYGVQIDGTAFSRVVVFSVDLAR
jgi:hypothetical protein